MLNSTVTVLVCVEMNPHIEAPIVYSLPQQACKQITPQFQKKMMI